jgi:hypothetical protein
MPQLAAWTESEPSFVAQANPDLSYRSEINDLET